MARYSHLYRSLLAVGWVLIMPPVPMGTELPPQSEWSVLSVHKTAAECERALELLGEQARFTITKDPNANSLKVSTALGALQAGCAETKVPDSSESKALESGERKASESGEREGAGTGEKKAPETGGIQAPKIVTVE